MRHWEDYFQGLMNNGTSDSEDPGNGVRGTVEQVNEAEIQQGLKAMRPKRAVDPD